MIIIVTDVKHLQILMNVNSTMEGVITIVPIPMVATTAFVIMGTFWKMIAPVVQVCVVVAKLLTLQKCVLILRH